MNRLILRWLMFYPLSILVSIFFRLLAPIVAIPVVRVSRVDTIKRFDKQKLAWPRDYLLPCFKWFATHDNAADEWWYGMYNTNFWLKPVREWTQSDYDTSWLIRYFCRVAWLWRNTGYGFSHYVLGINASEDNATILSHQWFGLTQKRWYSKNRGICLAWQVKGFIWLTKTYYIDINIGWKSHRNFKRLMYAGRIFALRRFK